MSSGKDEERGDEHSLVQVGTSDRQGSWVGRVGSTTSFSLSISHSLESRSIKTPTVTDVMASSHTWSARTSGFAFGTDLATGSVEGFGSSSMSMAGNGLSVCGFCLSAQEDAIKC